MCSSVIIKEAAMVTPAEPTPVRVLPLSAIDSQLFLGFTIEYLLVYKPCSGSDQGAITARLKTALSKALVPYYPFAGRVRAKPDGSTGLEVVCRAQGALFIHAVSNCFAMSDFERAPPTVTHWRKLLSFYVADVLIGDPPLVIQLTWLKDGSAAIGVGINHCICDGIGSAEFLNSLAELATERSGFGDIEPKPVWNRHLLNPVAVKSKKNINSTILPEFNRVPDVCGFLNRVSDELIPTSVVFDNRLLNELKRIALSTSPPGEFSYTSFEVLAGHVWRSWARALNFPSNQILKLLFSINIRNRVKPSLPAGYYGNAFVLGCAQTSVKDLVENGLEYASGLIKTAKERVNDGYVRRVIDSVSELRAKPDSVGVLILSQWSRLGLEMVDCGMGSPIHVGPICCDRYCLFLPVNDKKDAVKVMVAVPIDVVDNYVHLLKSSLTLQL